MMAVADKSGSDSYWHFDKSAIALIIGLIMTLLVQTGSFVWWASGLNYAVKDQDKRLQTLEMWKETQRTQDVELAKLGVMVTQLQAQRAADMAMQNWKDNTAARAVFEREQQPAMRARR